MNVEVVVVILSLFTQLARRIRPTIILIPVTTRFTGSAIKRSFLQWSAKVDHRLKIRGKIQALLDLVCDEF